MDAGPAKPFIRFTPDKTFFQISGTFPMPDQADMKLPLFTN
jgi:hypothetical protein